MNDPNLNSYDKDNDDEYNSEGSTRNMIINDDGNDSNTVCGGTEVVIKVAPARR